VAAADVPPGTPLILAVDQPTEERHRPGNEAVLALVRRFTWAHGPKEVIVHASPLGLVGNVFYCGGLAEHYGAVILLEDDLFVSARFYDYACQALSFYSHDPQLAGISLNALWFNGFTHQPFIPLPDAGDVFFLKLSTPQGQAYTAAQWAAFAAWLAGNDPHPTAADHVHELFTTFPPDDWLATKAKYLAATDKYYVYPRESLTTNFGEPGTHFAEPTTVFQVPLQQFRQEYRFQSLDKAVAVYDGFYEILPDRLNRLTDRLRGLTYDVDLYASKARGQLGAEYTLTTRHCRSPLLTFGKQMRPLEANVIAGIPGDGISLARREDVDTGHASGRVARRDNDRYFARNRHTGQSGQQHLARRLRRFLGR
jgi:hypothetical protein